MKKDEELKKEKKTKKEADFRVTRDIISFRVYLSVFIAIFALMTGQVVILLNSPNEKSMIIGIIVYYFVVTALIVMVLFVVIRRFLFGKTIGRVAEAARKITKGDFDTRIEIINKSDKKNEIDVLVDDFNQMVEQLQSVETLKSDFIANVSHEIKAPLSIIQTYAMAFKDPDLTPEQREECANTVIEATKRLSNMVSNILKLNKLENQEIQPTPAPYQLGEQLRKCALDQIESWQAKNIEFNIEVIDIIIDYDASLLEIVWNNLISNAIKFSPEKGRIVVASWVDNEYVYVAVKDKGSGMTPEVIDRVFDKFYQGDPSRATQGNGLGLALVKKVLQMVDGEITVGSQLNVGTTFTVKLKK